MMDISVYRIRHILRLYTQQLKSNQINTAKEVISSKDFQDEFSLSSDGKKKQFIDQLISKAVVQLTTCLGEERGKDG